MLRIVKAAGVAAVVLTLAACASQSYRTAWKAPDARPLSIQSGEKVVGVVVTADEANREAAESRLVAELNRRGLEGIAGHTLAAGSEGLTVAALKPAIEKSGAAAVVVMKVVDKASAGPTEQEPWNSWNWGAAYNAGSPVAGMVFVETRVFDLEQGKLVWVGQSQLVAPGDVDAAVRELVDEASTEMRKQGVIAS
jgi:hypothetical protein